MERCNNKTILEFSCKRLRSSCSADLFLAGLALWLHPVIGCVLMVDGMLTRILSAHTRTWLTALLLLIHFIEPSSSQRSVYLNGNVAKREERGKWGFLRWQSRVLVTASGRQFRPRKFQHLLQMFLSEMKELLKRDVEQKSFESISVRSKSQNKAPFHYWVCHHPSIQSMTKIPGYWKAKSTSKTYEERERLKQI